MTTRLADALGPVTAFEHGMDARTGRAAGGCVDHAHLQLLAVSEDLTESIAAVVGPPVRVSSLTELPRAVPDGEYLYYRPPAGPGNVFATRDLPSQFMRRLLAETLGTADEWNWRKEPHAARLVESVRLLAGLPTT